MRKKYHISIPITFLFFPLLVRSRSVQVIHFTFAVRQSVVIGADICQSKHTIPSGCTQEKCQTQASARRVPVVLPAPLPSPTVKTYHTTRIVTLLLTSHDVTNTIISYNAHFFRYGHYALLCDCMAGFKMTTAPDGQLHSEVVVL